MSFFSYLQGIAEQHERRRRVEAVTKRRKSYARIPERCLAGGMVNHRREERCRGRAHVACVENPAGIGFLS